MRFGRITARSLWILAGLVVIVGIVGCSGGKSSLSGNVTYDGKPLEDGTIQLRPTGETKGLGGTSKITNGGYNIPAGEALEPGTYSVAIMAVRPATPAEIAKQENSTKGEPQQAGDDEAAKPAAASAPTTQYIPAKYNTQTTLTVDITAGENKKDFALEK